MVRTFSGEGIVWRRVEGSIPAPEIEEMELLMKCLETRRVAVKSFEEIGGDPRLPRIDEGASLDRPLCDEFGIFPGRFALDSLFL